MGNARIPGAVAVALWSAAAFAVLGYTLKAYGETVSGGSGTPQMTPADRKVVDLAANAPALQPMSLLGTQPIGKNIGSIIGGGP